MVQKEGSRELTKKQKQRQMCVSPLAVLTAIIICGSMQLPHHKVIHKDGKHNTATTNNNTDKKQWSISPHHSQNFVTVEHSLPI